MYDSKLVTQTFNCINIDYHVITDCTKYIFIDIT